MHGGNMVDVSFLYTDGGCHNESGEMHGIGSYAFLKPVDLSNEYVEIYTRFVADTTNNRTEMLAILEGINFISKNSDNRHIIEVFTDSGYVVKGYNDPAYLDKWVQNDWKTSTKKPVLNRDLWERFRAIPWEIKFRLNLIRGHKKDNNPIHSFWNDICDQACTYTMENLASKDNMCKLRYYIKEKRIEFVEEVT